jgi:hypothetical protein
MKKAIPWSSIAGFLLLVALGIGIPFWLEFRSLANPPSSPSAPVREPRGDFRPSIDVRRGYYCGNCGGLLVLPEGGGASEHVREPLSPMSLNAPDRPTWDVPRSSTRTAAAAPDLREEP